METKTTHTIVVTATGGRFHASTGSTGAYDHTGRIGNLTVCGKRIVPGYVPDQAEVSCPRCLKGLS